MALAAQDEPDEDARASLLEDAAEASRDWGCPRTGKPCGSLPESHREALGAIKSLTGHEFKTCPLASAWAPWVHRVVEADEHGLAEDRAAYGPPPRALVDAVRVIRRARKARDAEEARVRREDSDK